MPDEQVSQAPAPVEPSFAPAVPMSPDVAPVSPQQAVAPPQAPEAPSFHKVIGPDGKLLEGWKNMLPEEIRGEQSLDMVTDFPGAFKQLVNAQKMIGKDKIVKPGPNATPSEKEAFQIALGRPQTKDGYKINLAPELAEGLDLEASKDLALQFGFNQETFDRILEFRANEFAEAEATRLAQEKVEFEEAERIIVAQAGEALDEQRHLANSLIKQFVPEKTMMPDGTIVTGEEYEKRLVEALNGNKLRPYVFNFLANIQRSVFGQHSGPPAQDGQISGAMTVSMMESKANDLMLTTGYTSGEMKNSNPEGYKRLTAEITDLYNRIEKARKSVG